MMALQLLKRRHGSRKGRRVPAPDESMFLSWYAADLIAGLSNNDPVSTWADLCAGGYNLTQGVAGQKPTFKTNVLNGLPGVYFDGGDMLAGAGQDWSASDKVHFWMVAHCLASGTQLVFEHGTSYAVNGSMFVSVESPKKVATHHYGGVSSNLTSVLSVLETPCIYHCFHDKSRASDEIEIFRNAAVLAGDWGAYNNNTTGNFGNLANHLGARYGTVFCFTGYVFELMYALGDLSTLQVQSVDAYLMNKWGL